MPSTSRRTHLTLWAVQTVLALLFLFAGAMKFVMPVEVMTKGTPLSGDFLHFIGVCETLGALGLILPGALRIRPGLTSLAAAGLVIIMTGAVVVSALYTGAASAIVPLVVGILATGVALGRWRVAPIRARARRSVLRPAHA
jgi:DoxX-like family